MSSFTIPLAAIRYIRVSRSLTKIICGIIYTMKCSDIFSAQIKLHNSNSSPRSGGLWIIRKWIPLVSPDESACRIAFVTNATFDGASLTEVFSNLGQSSVPNFDKFAICFVLANTKRSSSFVNRYFKFRMILVERF